MLSMQPLLLQYRSSALISRPTFPVPDGERNDCIQFADESIGTLSFEMISNPISA